MDKKDLKIVFLGTPEFAVCSLSRLLDEGFRIEAVVTAPDKPAGRGHCSRETSKTRNSSKA